MRKNKKQKKGVHVSFVQPIMVSILMAVSVPLVTMAAVRDDADLGADSPVYQIYNPRADQSVLFDLEEFRKAHRERYDELTGAASVSSSAPSSAASSVDPCAAAGSSSSSSSAAMLRYDDLSTSEQAELRKQLRIGGCPYDVEPGYRALCEMMLELRRDLNAEIPQGLRNPDQE